jgi:hypothetical protein
MPISCTCQCGKALRLKDEWVGKQAKCPGCGISFVVPALGGPVKEATTVIGAEVWGSRQRPQEKAGAGASFSMSPTVITFLVIAILVPLIIVLIKVGPVRAQRQWREIEPDAESAITTVVTRAIQSESEFNTAESRHAPGVQAVTMDATVITHVPEWVKFSGRSTSGFFNGRYNTKTGEIEADVPKSFDKGTMRVTGRVKDGVTEAQVDGKEAKVIFRKKTKEQMD